MIPLTAARIAEVLSGSPKGNPGAVAKEVTIDSRQAGPDSCFFAIAGARFDGHDFIDAAVGAGATVVVTRRAQAAARGGVAVEEGGRGLGGDVGVVEVDDTTAALQELATWLRAELDPIVVGITGSLGKTTTKELAGALIGRRYAVHATPGNLNNHWGLPLSLLGLQPHHRVMVAELAMSHAGEIRALARIAAPGIGVVTNIAPAHMENFADLDAVAAAKGELAEELPASATLVVNADDRRATAIARRQGAHVARVVRFGSGPDADVRVRELSPAGGGWTFLLAIGGETRRIDLNIPGAGGLGSFLAAAATAHALDVPLETIAAAAPELAPLANRGAIRNLGGVTLLDESYNASPLAMTAALDTLAGLAAAGRRIAVLGDMLEMGDWAERVHRQAGEHAAIVGIDLLVAVGDCAGFVLDGATAAGMDRGAAHRFDAADDAASWLVPRLRAGDTVLVKGSRGIHLEKVIEAVTDAAAVSNDLVEG